MHRITSWSTMRLIWLQPETGQQLTVAPNSAKRCKIAKLSGQ